jgi:maltooligosyltrehalose trehalohydrolase
MHTFRVWAPAAARVEVIAAGRAHAMQPARGGWWVKTARDATAGTRYLFSIDGGPGRPDPRSAFQPDGVDGPSQVVDHDAFPWHDHSWRGLPLRGAVLYELHIGTFTPEGTFDGAIGHLGHLVALGVDAVEVMPVAEFAGSRGWGYDAVDLFAPHHAYGGPDGLKRFVDACHAAGLGVVMDVVYNHLGPAGNYLPEFGPYFTARHQTNWGDAVNFDGPGSTGVRRFVIDNALMWLRDYHCDGLRLDAVHAIVDDSAVHILEALATEVDALACHLRRPLFLIAESDLNDPRFVRSRAAGGYGLEAAWADEWHHALHAALTGERHGYYQDFGTLARLAKALRQAWVYDGQWSPHRRRAHGRTPEGLSGHQFVVFTQNHDQVGNRALGERLSALTSTGRLKAAAALLLTGPFTPLLFQGEEWAASSPFQYFTDHLPDLGRAVRDGRRREFATFGWDPPQVPDPQDPATFERSKLDWSEPIRPPHCDLLDWYRDLIALRRRLPALSDPRLDRVEVTDDEDAGWVRMSRGPLAIAASLNPHPVLVPLPDRYTRLLLTSAADIRLAEGGLTLPADAVAIVAAPAL